MFLHEGYDFLLLMAAVLGAFVFCQKTHTSLALGYLFAGLLLGPLGLKIFSKSPFLATASEVGLLLFLFTVGLEIPFHRIKALRRYIFGFGAVQVGITTLVLTGCLSFFLPWLTAFLLGLSLSFSSTAVVVQLLSERHALTSQMGRTALSVLLFQDIAAIGIFVFLAIQSSATGSGDQNQILLKSFLGMVLTMGLGFALTKVTEKAMSAFRYSEFITAFVLASFLGFSLMTEWFHLSAELGAFVAGIAMASTHWRHQIGAEIHPFRTLLLAMFFVIMGLEVNAWPSWSSLGIILASLTGIMALKSFIVMACAWSFGLQGALPLGLLIGGCSEFLFMVVPLLRNSLSPELSNGILMMGLVSMMITPLLFLLFKEVHMQQDSEESISSTAQPSVVIGGFGQVGQTMARILENNFIPFVVVDYDTQAVEKAKELNYPVIHGDPRDIEFLKRIKIYQAKALVITFGHLSNAVELVRMIRRKYPELAVCVQVRDYGEASHFSGLGTQVVVPEAMESGIQMAFVTLKTLGYSDDYAQKMVHFPEIPHFFGVKK